MFARTFKQDTPLLIPAAARRGTGAVRPKRPNPIPSTPTAAEIDPAPWAHVARRLVLTPLGFGPVGDHDLGDITASLDGLTVRPGDRVHALLMGGRHRDFHVAIAEPSGPVKIGAETTVAIQGAAQPPRTTGKDDRISYDAIGGLACELARIREMVELPLTHPEVFERLGMQPPKGVLLCGPPGCGKTLLARAVAEETTATFIHVSGPEILQKHYGESEARLREIFDDAARRAPSIIFFDEIDSLAPPRDQGGGEAEKRVVAQLLTLMDGLKSRGEVVVMAATNRPNSLDPALRRPGRFDREIHIAMPNAASRREILEIQARGMPLADDVDLDHLAEVTHGFTGADMQSLCREAALAALRRQIPPDLRAAPVIPRETVMALDVSGGDFREALTQVRPSGMREVAVERPNVAWTDVGGLSAIKAALKEAITWPLSHPHLFAEVGLRPSRGLLLYGPPGNGKTLVARALASQSGLNFISIKGPELLSKYVGESERGVRDLFARARQVAPCIVFLDEVDALAPRRGGDTDSGVTDRVVSQLLTELDGVETLKDVWVIAATNRRDMIDPALLRPGRLDQSLEAANPDHEGRAAVLDVHLRHKPVGGDVDALALAQRTEGMSAAEVRAVCDRAAMNAVRRAFAAAAPGADQIETPDIGWNDFEASLTETKI